MKRFKPLFRGVQTFNPKVALHFMTGHGPLIYTIEEAEAEWGYCVKDLTKRIEALKPGETFTDEAGDVWERLS